MKKVLVVLSLLATSTSYAQLHVNHLGLHFNFNLGYKVPNGLAQEFFDIPLGSANAQLKNVSVSRVMSDYKIGFNTTKYRFLQWEADVLQGVEFVDYYYSDYQLSDSILSESISTNIEASLIGLRTMAKVTTDIDERFVFDFGLGVEGLLAYDLGANGYYTQEVISSNNQFTTFQEKTYLEPNNIKRYGSTNLTQQAGMAFRLGKDETKAPFDKVMIETNFQIISNFTFASGDLYRYRTFGGIIGITYEFR